MRGPKGGLYHLSATGNRVSGAAPSSRAVTQAADKIRSIKHLNAEAQAHHEARGSAKTPEQKAAWHARAVEIHAAHTRGGTKTTVPAQSAKAPAATSTNVKDPHHVDHREERDAHDFLRHISAQTPTRENSENIERAKAHYRKGLAMGRENWTPQQRHAHHTEAMKIIAEHKRKKEPWEKLKPLRGENPHSEKSTVSKGAHDWELEAYKKSTGRFGRR